MAKHTMYKSFSCDLTTEEINTYSQELASITTEQSEIEGEKKEIMSTFTARLNKCIADGRVLARKITTRKEDRQVECDLDFDYAKGMVYTIRTDTGVTIGQRKLTDDERQQWLDLDAEEGRRQEAEDKRNEAPEENVIEGELLQIKHKPEEEEEEPASSSVCLVTTCEHYDAAEPNGCKELEMIWECERTPEDQVAEKNCNLSESEILLRDKTCDEWHTCDHGDICMDDSINTESACFKDEPEKLPTIENKAIAHAQSTKVIPLADSFFDDKGPLRKAFPPMAGIPDNGKIGKVFTEDGIMFVLHGAMYHGGMASKYYAYQLVERSRWNEEMIPVVTIAKRMSESRKTHLIYTGCLVTYKGAEYVMYRPVDFVRESEAGPSLLDLCEQCKNYHPSCASCCKTCKTPCNTQQNCRWPNAEVA